MAAGAAGGPIGLAVAGTAVAVLTISGLVLVAKNINGRKEIICECKTCEHHRNKTTEYSDACIRRAKASK